jgi:hypothetical protein
MANRTLKTVADVIAALGGTAEVAKWAGYDGPSGVSNWLLRGIPPSYHLTLSLEAKRRGYFIDPSVYGLEEDDAEVFRSVFRLGVQTRPANAAA